MKLAELSSNSFQWKNVKFCGVKTYSDPSYLFSEESRCRTPMIYALQFDTCQISTSWCLWSCRHHAQRYEFIDWRHRCPVWFVSTYNDVFATTKDPTTLVGFVVRMYKSERVTASTEQFVKLCIGVPESPARLSHKGCVERKPQQIALYSGWSLSLMLRLLVGGCGMWLRVKIDVRLRARHKETAD